MKTFGSFSVSFYTRFNKNRKKDCSIYCCIKLAKRSTELCVLNSIKKDEWDIGKATPKQDNDYLVKLSIFLDSIKARLFDIYMDIRLSGKECTTKKIKDIYLGIENYQLTFLQVIDKAIDKYKPKAIRVLVAIRNIALLLQFEMESLAVKFHHKKKNCKRNGRHIACK